MVDILSEEICPNGFTCVSEISNSSIVKINTKDMFKVQAFPFSGGAWNVFCYCI